MVNKNDDGYITAWMEVTRNGDISYFERQFENPYRSTLAFCDWLKSSGCLSSRQNSSVADVGAGMGEALSYVAGQFPNVDFTGIEINPELVHRGNQKFQEFKIKNARLVTGDIYGIDKIHQGNYQGIISMQTLSFLPEFQTPLGKIIDLSPEWIAVSSLFYDGDVNCKIETEDYTRPTHGKPYCHKFYNVYSLGLVEKFLKARGYGYFCFQPFNIDIDLPKPEGRGLGTRTLKLEDGQRIQVSGPLLMSWYFVMARKGK